MADIFEIAGRIHSTSQEGVATVANEILDETQNKKQSEVNADVARHETEIHGTGGIDSRLSDVEQMEQIVISGGDAQIATGADFTNPDATKRAKVPTVGAIVDGLNDGIYDVSKRNPSGGPNSDGKFTLEYILSNANTLIPTSWRHGGMSISFVSTYDNKYVQFRYMGTAVTGTPNPFLDTANWQGVDDEPTAGSQNLVKSGGVKNSIEHSKFSEFNKKNIEKIYSDLLYTFDWAIGTINATTGEYQNSSPAQREFICTPDIVTLLENTIISRDEGYVAYYYKFSEGAFVERIHISANGSTLPAGQYKFSIKNNTQSIERTTIYELLLNIHSDKTVGILKPFIDNTNDAIGAINENVANLRTVVNGIKEDSIYQYPWAIGSTSSSTGEYNPNVRDRITTPTIVTLIKETTFTVDEGWTLYAFSYVNGEYTGAYSTTSGTSRSVAAGQYKFTVVKNENPTILKSIYPPLSHLQSDDITRDTSGLDEITIEEGSVWK